MARRKPVNYNIIFGAAMMLIIIAAIWGYLVVIEDALIESQELAEDFYQEPDPVSDNLLEYSNGGLSRAQISAILDDNYSLLVNKEDINADGRPEFVLIETNPTYPDPDESLQEEGYQQTIAGMIIYRKVNGTMIPIFTLTEEAMRDENGDVLLGQVQADYGYAFQMHEYEDQAVFLSSVRVFEIALLNEQGQAVSDDITIYWDPALNLYRGTNTFGAPGTFTNN